MKLNYIKTGCLIDNKEVVVEITDLDSSKYLKEKGFNKKCIWFWIDKDLPFVKSGLSHTKGWKNPINHNNYDDFVYSAPTREQAEKWLKIKI